MTSALTSSSQIVDSQKLRQLNDRIMLAERGFLELNGLRNNAWYRHLIFSPSKEDAYGGTAFPTLYDALSHRDFEEAQIQLQLIAVAIENAKVLLSADQQE
jgi:hypothetical protein